MVIAARSRAKRKGLAFDIVKEDLFIPEVCPILNIEMLSPSIDRIDNTKGYIKGNVRIISKRANRLKSDMTLEECKLILKDLENCQ